MNKIDIEGVAVLTVIIGFVGTLGYLMKIYLELI